MGAEARVGFRPPLTSVLPAAAVLALLGVVLPSPGLAPAMIVFVVLFAAVRLRQLTVLTDSHVEVTVVRTRRIPWAEIESFEAGSALRGGTVIRTTSGTEVHAVAPCTWWGGPADEQDLEVLRRMQVRRARRR